MSEVDKFLDEYEKNQSQGQAGAGQQQRPRTEVDDLVDAAPDTRVGFGRSVADTGVSLGASLLTGAQLMTNVAGADNAASQALGRASDYVRGFESAARREERAARARKIEEAEQSGNTWREIGAHLGAFAEAPIDTTIEALGTSAPTLLAAALTRGRGGAAVPATVGTAQGAGAVKGSIYEQVEQEYLKAGASPEEAAARAAEAQSYSGENAGQIALGAGLGAVAGSTGIESAVGRVLGREAGEAAAHGVVKSAAIGAAAEAPIEAAQGGQERLAGNIATQNEGFDTPLWQGVAGSAALEGVAGGAAGGGFGAIEGFMNRQPAVDPLADQPADDPMAGAGEPEPEVPPAAPGMAPGQVPGQYRRETLGADPAQPAVETPVAEPVRAPTPSEQMGIDPNAGPLSAAASIAVDTGTTEQLAQQAALQQAAEAAEQAQKKGGKQARVPEGVDPQTGEVLQQGSLQDGDPVVQMQSRLDYLQQQARRTGWNKQLVRERDQIQARLRELGVQPEPREQVQSRAEEAAAQTLASGGTETDATRAATDTLIDGMAAAPDIEIARDAPAAVSAAKARTQESRPEGSEEDQLPVSIAPPVQVSEDAPPSKERNRAERIRKLQDQGFEVANETHNTYEGAVGRASQLNSAKDGHAYFARQVGFGTRDGGEYIVLRTPAEGGFKQGSEVDKFEEGQRWMTPSGQIITVSRTEDSSKPGMDRDAFRDRQRGTFKINGRDETYLLTAMDNYLLLGSDTKQSADAGDSAISDADGYKARSADRLERINKATSKDEIDEILKEHASDPAGHVDGYSRMEAKAKDAKRKIDNPPRTDLVEGYTNPSPRQAQMDVDRLNETNPGHELVRMQGEWGEYYAIKKPSASQGKGQESRSPEQADDPKRAKALARINSEKGAFFFSEQKAQAFIDSNGLSNEYALEQQGRAFKVVPKSESAEPAAQQAAPQIEGRDSGDGEKGSERAQREAADRFEKHVREIAGEFNGLYQGRSLAPLATDIAEHAIATGRRLTDEEMTQLSEKHEVPVEVVYELVRQPFSYDGIGGASVSGDEDAKALLRRIKAKAKTAEAAPADTSDPWSFVESYRAADGFEADIKSRQGVSGATVFGAFNKDGLQLFGNQLFPSADDVKAAIDPTTKPANAKEGIEQARKKKAKEKAAKDGVASTAPEHRAVGVDDRELSEIVSEFEDAQSAMLDGDFKMHHLFDPPAKGEIVRLQDKVKVYNKDHGWMTPAEAKARIAEWKQHAAKQGDKNRMENSNRVVLSLFDYTGKWSQPWEEAGYQVYRFDIQQESMAELMGEDVNIGDVHNFGHEYFADLFGHFDGNDVYAILAACPCTDFASSGARHFAAKDKDGRTVASVKLVHQTLATIEYFKPAVWAIENPVGRIERLGGLPPWRLSFDPNHLGDPYTKKTLLWGRFNADLPIAPVEPTEGSKMHSRYGGSSIATKNARSATPEGFAYGFFMANNAIDNPVMAISNKYDRLDREAIKAAVDAGLTEAQIDSLVADHYYMDMDDEAANNALREAAREAAQETAGDTAQQVQDFIDGKRDTPPELPSVAQAEPNLEAARKLLQEQKDATGNKKAEANVKRKIRALAKKTPSTDERTVLALDMAATRLDMENLEFSEPAAAQPAPAAESGRKYHVVRINEKTGKKVTLSDTPMTHQEAVTFKSKQTKYEWARDQLEEVTEQASGGDTQATGPSTSQAISDFIEGRRPDVPTTAEVEAELQPAAPESDTAAKGARRPQPGDEGYTLLDARNDLIEARTKVENQGLIANDRDMQRVRQLEQLVKDMEAEQSAAREQSLSQQLAGMTNAELSALIDEVINEDAQVADTAKPVQKRKRRTSPKKAEPKPRQQITEVEATDIADGAEVDRTAGEIAKSLGYNVSSAGMEAIKGLTKLFGGNGRLSSGLTFDEDTYAKAKPHFQAMLKDAQAAGKDIKDFIRLVLQQFGSGVKPYIIRFANDQRDEVATTPEAQANERTEIRGDGPQALADVAAAEGGQPESDRGTGASAADSGQERATGSAGSDAAGVPAARSGRGGTGSVRNAPARARRQRGAVGEGRGSEAAEAVPQDDARVEVNGEPTSAPNIPAANFQITEETQLGKGGEVQKFNDNLAAIRTLKQIEADHRRATPEEQAVLARYVGWGGLANAFPDPTTGNFKDRWKERGEQLRSLLTDDEYKAARRSTRNAHYTSETVVTAMWKAVEKMGFKGGLVLESSMGTGNFVGLAPQNTGAKFIGIEYDSLTARMAQALYPQATVLHSGFQRVPLTDNSFALNIGNPPFGSESLRFQYKPELQGVSIHNQFFRAGMDALRPGGIQAMVVSRYLMDAQDKSTRLALAKQARLVGLIRLPDTAFRENARTEVVTDIVILQKLSPEEQADMAAAVEAYQRGREKDAGKERERQALAARVPAWVETAQIPDPLGGEAMTVNAHFRDNPQDILGTLERSGSMQHGADITVRLDNAADLQGLLDSAIERLPSNIQNLDAEVLAATEDRFKSMSDALRIAIANEEVGHVSLDRDGKLQRVIERETPEGDYEYARQEITADSPWSDQLSMDADGKWYRLVVKTDGDGNPVKVVKDGKTTRFNVYERTTFDNEADIPSSLRLGKTGFERLTGMVRLRDLLKRQLTLETADAAKGVMEANRKALAKAYDEFTKKHGPINRPVNLRLAMTMPDGGLVAALEVGYQPARTAKQAEATGLDVQEEIATPAPIMRERVVPKYEPATRAESPSDALAISLAESGRVNMERIASLLETTKEDAAAQLQAGDSPLVFLDPETQQWETADVYLTGMVKRKLQAAKAAGASKNVAALEKVIPEDWTAENIAVQMGATWVPPGIYADFLNHLTGGSASVSFSPVTNSYSVSVKSEGETAAQWGTEDVSVDYIVGRLLNSQAVVVTRTDSEGKTYVDREATSLAGLKAREITAEFGDWVFKDGDRRNQLVELFNEKFNTRVGRQYNGQHMSLPGKVPDSIIKMRRHQMNGVWRGVYERFVLYDHAVGAGKTFTAIARAMERRRMGLSRKPMIVVPNHLVEQWEADVYRLYPGAKVLAAGKKDFEAKRRRRLFGKIATGDWDIVIVPHSSFGFIGISPETESRYLEQELREAHAAIEAAWEQAEEDGVSGGRRKPFGVKEAERLAEKLQARADAVAAGVRDRLLTFEQLGVDDLTVDEAHEFKNLNYSSRLTGVRGMGDKSGSRKANDLYNKIRVLRENPNGSVAFLTGTPISNSAVEMFTMLRYLAADQLEEMGMTHFDAFRAQFVEATPAFEPTESGRLKEVTRLGRTWSNMRSLMELYYTVTDAVSLEDIKRMYTEDNNGAAFPVPKVKGGKDRELIAIKPTPAQEQALTEILAGFDGLDGIEDPYERNAERLRLMDRARKVSLDIRAVNPRSDSTEPNGKLEQVSKNVKRIYDQWSDDKGTQLIFLDRSVPKAKGDDKILKEYDDLVAKRDEAMARGDQDAFEDAVEALDKYDSNEINELRIAQSSPWNAYQQIKDNLVAMGIPANEIRFVQEANNDEQKAALFDAVKSGMVRVLLGSTPRMGAGTNVQDLAVALHHVDVTWKPSDIEQREGRVIRQGNKLLEKYGPDFEVEILAYATERTVDAKMWDLNATKLRTINGIRKYDGAFSMEFEDEEAVGMAEMAALASGNPLLLERVQLESEIGNLELQERAHRRKMYAVQDELSAARRYIERNPDLIESARSRADTARQRVDAVEQAQASRSVTVEGQQYSDLSEALAAASNAVSLQQAGNESARYAITIDGKRVTSKDGISNAISGALGDSSAFEATIDGERVIQRTAAARRAADMLNAGEGTRTVEVGELFGYQLVADVDVSDIGGVTYTNLSLALMDGGETIARIDANEQQGEARFVTANLRAPIDRLVEAIKAIATGESARYLERQLERAKRDLPSLEERAGEAFPKAEELARKRARLAEVVVELDAAAPQASSAEVETGDAIGNRGTFDPASQGIRRSFAGRRALTSQPMALETAQLRIAGGEDTEVVRMETGWHRGNDGKWRYEISDDQASLAVPGQTFGDIHANAYANAFADGRKQVTVSDILHHDQLFAAYPALAEIPVSPMGEGERASARLQRRATGMAIQVQPGMRRSLVASALLHELQHGIQTIEGFARGGSAKNLASELDRTGAETYRRLAGEVEARNTQTRQGMNAGMRQRIAPEMTADVPASDVIVTFNGRDMIHGPLPGNAQTRPAMTQGQILRAFQVRFPKLVPAVRTMLARGAEGKRGGLVLVDSADPLMIARAFSKKTGRPLTDTIQLFSEAGTINGFFDPQSGLTFLVTPNLDAVTAPAVLLHEMVHGQQRRRIDERAVEMLMNRAKFKDPELRAFLDRVAERMIDAGESTNMEEAAPYIVEQAVIEGRSQGYALADSRFLSWVDKTIGQRVGDLIRSMLANVRSWMLRNGMKPGEITVDDLVGYAMAGVERAAAGRVDGGDVAFSREAITSTPEFKRWFGDSKVVDAQGKPLVVYHGTQSAPFTAFRPSGEENMFGAGEQYHFTDNQNEAQGYASGNSETEMKGRTGTGRVMGVYLSMNRPADLRADSWNVYDVDIQGMMEAMDTDGILDALKAAGYDGIIHDGELFPAPVLGTHFVVFKPTQIKSATDNVGTFDPANPDIRFSRSGVKQLASRATLELNRTFNAPGKLHWWHKTVGTMYNLAERSPAFKPVFEAAQGFIDDVAHYAADAAELAPKLLPRLETWRDILRRPISADDNKAISAPIFEGTLVWARDGSGKPVRVDELEAAAASMTTEQKVQALMDADKIPAGMLKAWQALPEDQFAKMIDSRYESQLMKPGVVWTDAELRSMFKLNDEQVALYREFRAATDRSLDTMARADMLRFVGDDAKDLRDAVMDAADVHEASRLLVNHLQELSQAMPDRETQLMQMAHGIMERAARVRELQAEGYAPLSRFGKYTVYVEGDGGVSEYFGMFESIREANSMAEKMRELYPSAKVTQGTKGNELYKMFAGITPESVELFGNMLGLDSTGDQARDQAFQEYLRLTKNNHSAMRRLIHRKGVAGFSEDVGRVLASFVYSNARQTAAGLNMGDLGEAVSAIPKEQGELQDAAMRLSEYIKNPQEEAQAMRGLLFAQYLGGSVASAFVNLTQPVQVTFPWLSQHAGARGAAKEISRAVKQMSTRGHKYEPDLAQALKEAEDDGTVSPQEVHQLMAQARGSGSLRAGDGTRAGEARAFTSNQIARLSLAWGKMFGAAEQANRRITFIAAYRVARDKGMPDPGAFARRAVQETQFVYSKAAKMQWGRGAIGGTLMTFKTYTVSYIELMHRLWNQGEPGSEERAEGRKAAMLMVATLMLMGGVGGLPFAEDMEDLIDGAAQLMGYNFSSRQAKEQFLRDVFGDAMGDFIEKGVSGLPGAPMDVSGRLGMGNLIPGTGLFTERTSHTRDVLEILGPGGDFANRILSGGRQILGGDVGAGLLEMSPVAVRNVAKGADMAVHGMYRDTKGYKVLDTDILDAALKAAGFQPAGVAKIQEANWINQRAKNFYNMQAQEIRALWATGIFEGDQAKVQRARDRVAEWNRKNPDQPMIIRIPDVMRRVREMGKTKDQRIAATAPRAMRAQMREDLARVRSEL